nr:hypothetical protein [Tanacetum cinerariifolium]
MHLLLYRTPSVNPNPNFVHPIVTRYRVGTNRPVERLTLYVSSVSPLPRSYRDAFNDVNWHSAMRDEYNALIKNTDGMLSRYKARLVANGRTQLEVIDVVETFSLVVKPGTIRTVLSLAASQHWPDHQLDGCFLSQKKYVVEILERAGMVHCNPSRTPIDTESKLGTTGDAVSVLTLYQCLGDSLQYLTFTKRDISFVVQQVCLHMHDPRKPHFSALKRILCYVCGTLDYGCSYSPLLLPTLWLIQMQIELAVLLLDDRLQGTVSFLATIFSPGLISVNRRFLVSVPRQNVVHQRTKHIEIDIHFVRDLVAAGQVWVLHVPSRYQFAYIFSKGLPTALFEEFRFSLSVG